MDRLQAQRERTYLHNITPKTRNYLTAWKAFLRAHAEAPARTPDASILTCRPAALHRPSARARGEGSYVQLLAAGPERVWPVAAHGRRIPQPVRLPPQREEKRLLQLHDQTALRALIRYRPKTYIQWRVHAVACTILDTGCRIEELLTARVIDFDFDNLLLTVAGKGRKQRRVPFSVELRKVLFRFAQVKARGDVRSDLMFPARDGGKWEHRNARRSYYCLLKHLSLPQSGFHLLRHTSPTQYLRNGGAVVRLSIILGHSEISTTMKYLHLLTEDLQRPHQSLSILNRLR
jgi:integrase